ncbi:MAG: RIP metalloprotease RseP [Spirochaetes bacterium]|uniref:Zinc metalloprotease n=1 Tax=Candidatus Ornithospirochaeta stercoripullorum TaxID=2840899 RepID=A0A9D9DZ23_9SPIO|nr:RIP metalloprotease RseP [Candidatus Ornithospirochaeta stercoripullorum]
MLKLLYLILGLLGIGLIIFLHELGHFIAARLMHVDVEVLSYGMGPRLFSIYGRKTEYRLSLIPFGGYCRMKGSLDLMKALKDDSKSMEKTEEGSYFGTTPFSRFLIYLSGPLMNFLLAIVMLAVLAIIPVDRLSDPAIITPISEYPEVFNSNVEQPSVEKGDKLIASGDYVFADWQDAEDFISSHSGEDIPVTIERDGRTMEIVLHPSFIDGNCLYGISNLQKAIVGRSLSESFKEDDRIVKADGKKIEYTLDLYSIDKDSFSLTIDRNGTLLEREITEGSLPFAWKSSIRKSAESVNPLAYGVKRTSDLAGAALSALGAFITFHLEDALAVMTGPVKAAESIGGITALAFSESGASGIRALLLLLAIVSVSIAVGNLLPIPTFDGGQMLINIAEMISGKALSPRSYVILQIAGMIAALIIMAAMYSLDIKAYFFS